MRILVLPIGCVLISASAFFAAVSVAQSPTEPSSPKIISSESVDSATGGKQPSSSSNASGEKKTEGKSVADKLRPANGKTGPGRKAQGKNSQSKSSQAKAGAGKGGGSRNLPGITPEREAAVMTFVKRHHSELTELLIHLKEYAPKEYDRAVRDLLRTSERLAQIQERDSVTYELELQSWRARSRAQLLAARLQMRESSELREQLRVALNDEYDLRLQLLERDREKTADRLKNLGDQIDRLGRRRAEEIDKQMKQLTSVAGGGDKKANAGAKEDSPARKKSETRTNE